MKQYDYLSHLTDAKETLNITDNIIVYDRWLNDRILMSLEDNQCPGYWWFFNDKIHMSYKKRALKYCIDNNIRIPGNIRARINDINMYLELRDILNE